MKLLKIFKTGLPAVVVSFFCVSCTRDIPQVAPLDPNLKNAATVQIFDATVKSTRNYVYVDDVPVSGAAVAFGGVFPGTAYAFKVNPGSRNFLIKDTLATTTQVPLTFTAMLDAAKSYTIFTYDTTTSIKQVTVQNNIIVPKDTSCMLRFANFIYNADGTNVDVYSFRRGTAAPVFSNVANTQVTDFIPYASGLTDTLYIYATGTTTPLLTKSFLTSLTPTRSYTATYCGSFKGTKSVTTFATY